MRSFLENLEWRRAVKKFVPGAEVDTCPIRDAIVAAPSSFGVQPYKVIAVRDPALKAALREVSYGQPQVTDCDTLFIFCRREDVTKRAAEYLDATAAPDSLRQMLGGFLTKLGNTGRESWADRQTYLALGFALAAAAEAQVPSCPMEGFDASSVAHLLNLEEKGLWPLAYLAVGQATPGDDGTYPRFRFPASDLIQDL